MALTDTLNAIGSVVIGSGGSASAAYPVIGRKRTTSVSGPEDQNAGSYREETWELRCITFAANEAAVAALNETLRTTLCQRGALVTLSEFGQTRTLPAGAAVSGSLPGYPMIELIDDQAFGTVLYFTLRITTRVPNSTGGVGGNLVEHSYERSEETDPYGLVTIRQSGTVRVINGQNAKTYAAANITDAEATAADGANQTFTIVWRTNADAALVRYEFTRAPRAGSAGGDVDEAEIDDRTEETSDGRTVRTISGRARGSDATTFAEGLEPAASSTSVLTRRSISEPAEPDGWVSFNFQLTLGVTDATFPGLVIVSFSQSISPVGGGRDIVASRYYDADPILMYGVKSEYRYIERTSMEFVGSWLGAEIPLLMDAANLESEVPPAVYSVGGGIRRVEVTRVYVYETQQTTPTPYEIPAL